MREKNEQHKSRTGFGETSTLWGKRRANTRVGAQTATRGLWDGAMAVPAPASATAALS